VGLLTCGGCSVHISSNTSNNSINGSGKVAIEAKKKVINGVAKASVLEVYKQSFHLTVESQNQNVVDCTNVTHFIKLNLHFHVLAIWPLKIWTPDIDRFSH
jgi:hypothetical protein